MFAFRTRRSEREQQTDARRFQKFFAALDALECALSSEKSGLQRRYDSDAASAAFALQQCEDEYCNVRLSAKVEDLTRTLKANAERLRSLDNQIGLVRQLRATVFNFLESHEPPRQASGELDARVQ